MIIVRCVVGHVRSCSILCRSPHSRTHRASTLVTHEAGEVLDESAIEADVPEKAP